ncbi:MAG: hypothetical protein EZS28_012508 [Streblomastix strix]|uniref:Uncharacterized protein n=1 Tax=Streblomastix strix TaxID=222440 RepID=A0A5J4WBM9_9EUKA|nr:MAG: hypothetical protein EZS28_012508 [Streblomastix strix]
MIVENNGLPIIEHSIEIAAFENEQLEQGTGNASILGWRSKLVQGQCANQKDLQIIGSRQGEFEHSRYFGKIQSKTDNTTECFSIGKAKAQYHLRKAIDSILQIEQENGWTLTIRRIAWKWNKEVGALSRLSMAGDYLIRNEVLEEVLKEWKVEITVDLLAARNNVKHKKFFTLANDKKTIRTRFYENFLRRRVSIIWWTQLKEITVREKEFGESEKVLEMGSKMKKRNMKVLPGRILALEVNGDKTEQDYFEMLQKHPDYQEIQLDLQCITGLDVEKSTSVLYQPFGTI